MGFKMETIGMNRARGQPLRAPTPTIRGVKRALLTLPAKQLKQAEGIAVFGSLARGYDWHERSDIDIVVVVKKRRGTHGIKTMSLWYHRMRDALSHYHRDVTVLVYTVDMVKEVPSWEALRMCTDAKVMVDNNGICKLFKRVVKAAEDAGLRQKWFIDQWIWYKPRMKPGDRIEFRVP
jgi:predicted nucleotidyltransferase